MVPIRRETVSLKSSLNGQFLKTGLIDLLSLVPHNEYYPQHDHAKQNNLKARESTGRKITEETRKQGGHNPRMFGMGCGWSHQRHSQPLV